MKPLTLKIAGLNSFRKEQEIEFGALLEDGLFGIFGPTGSGKSTILDAITLALYGRVKRAPGGKGGIINLREKTCTVHFAFEIDCEGDRARYTVERVLALGRNDSVQTKRARLLKHDGDVAVPIADKQGEIDAKILELLGVEYDEFMRAVVLPQGAFSDFLGLKPKDRAGVLQRLFGLQELGHRLGSRLKAESDAMKTTRAGIEGRLAELRMFDDDAVAAADSRLADAIAAEAAARAANDEAAAALAAAEELWALLAEQSVLRAKEATRAQREAELTGLRERLDRSMRASQMSASLDALERADARLADSSARLAEAVAALDVARARSAESSARFERVDADYRERFDGLNDEIAQLESAAREEQALRDQQREADAALVELHRSQAELADAQSSQTRLRQEVAALEASVAEHEVRLRSVEVSREEHDRLSQLRLDVERLRERERVLAERRKANVDLESEIASLASTLATLQQEESAAGAALHDASTRLQMQKGVTDGLERELDAFTERHRRLASVLEMVSQLEEQCRTHELACSGHRSLISEQDTKWKVLENKFSGVSERHMSLKVEREEVREQLQDAYRRNAIATLAPQLRDGEPCPLCGSLDHAGKTHSGVDGQVELTELEAVLNRLDAEIVQARNGLDMCSQDMERITTTKSLTAEALRRDELALKSVRAQIDSTLAAAGESLSLTTSADLARFLSGLSVELAGLRGRLEEARECRNLLEESMPQMREASAERSRRCAEIATSVRNKREQHLEARNAATILESEIAEIAGGIASRSGDRTPDRIEHDLERMRENDRVAEHLRGVVANEQRKLAMTRSELEGADALIVTLAQAQASAESIVKRIAVEVEARTRAIDAIVSARRASDETAMTIAEIAADRTTRRDRLVRDRSEAQTAQQEAASDVRVTAASVEHHRQAHDRDVRDRDRSASECASALTSAGFASPEDARRMRLDASEQNELRASISSIDDELRALSTRLEETATRIGGRVLDEHQLEELRRRSRQASATCESAIGSSAAARSDRERIGERNIEYHHCSSENAGALDRERTIEQLGKFLQGDAFINFLADERLADVCRRASRLLEDLSGGRFAIVSTPNDGFLVRDMGNGGAERAPSSLSGGETFIVSLSLALALSDTIQLGRAPLEFFFLDEGFGTLDAELLDAVVDTLERLRSRHRTIGLITHVAALRERVPRRLIISPPSDNAGSIVRYEVA